MRRLIPITSNLAAWLKPIRKKAGPVCSLKSIANYFIRLVHSVNKNLLKGIEPMTWKKNAVQHSCVSYRIAECADVARVDDESGNSPAIFRSAYLKRVKPAQAAAWFNVMPTVADGAYGKIWQMLKSLTCSWSPMTQITNPIPQTIGPISPISDGFSILIASTVQNSVAGNIIEHPVNLKKTPRRLRTFILLYAISTT